MKVFQVSEDFFIPFSKGLDMHKHIVAEGEKVLSAGENYSLFKVYFDEIKDHQKRSGMLFDSMLPDLRSTIVFHALQKVFAYCGFRAEYFSREGFIHLYCELDDTEKFSDRALHLVAPFVTERCEIVFQAQKQLYLFQYYFKDGKCHYKTANIQWV